MKTLSKVLIVVAIPCISLINSGCQGLNQHKPPRDDMYFSVPDSIPELQQKVPFESRD